MPATPIPLSGPADSTGLSDLSWINDVRDALEDYPKPQLETWTSDGVNGPLTFGAAPLFVQFPPIFGSTADGTAPTIRDTTTGTNYTTIDSGTPSGNQILVNYNTGALQFSAAPAALDVIAFSYQSVRWRDSSILSALMDGLRAMFPIVGKTYVDQTIQIQVNVWDYQLPAWFADPRSRLISLEIADPFIPTEPFRPAPPGEERIGLDKLHLPWSQAYSPVARLRITGWGPYLRLADLEPQLYNLPIYYALGVLLPKRETKRIREDTLVPLAQVGGVQPGLHMQTGDYWMRRFGLALATLARFAGPGRTRPMTTTYQRRRY